MTYGNHGKLLRINLQHNSFQVEDISTKVWQEVIGGKGLGTYLLLQEVNPATDPLSAENKLIFVTGPACDTHIPASSRYGVFSKSPLTGIYAESSAGGHVAPFMKRTGFDAIILEDKASSPIFLHINQGGATFYEADNIWGMETYLLKSYIEKLKEKGKTSAAVKAYYNFGTPLMVSILNEVNSFPSRYWYQGSVENRDNISAEYMIDNLHVRPRACRGCIIACGKKTTVLQGQHKGLLIEGPEYETIYSFGGLCYIQKMEDIIYLNDLCDRLGMDTISTGNLAALSIEGGLRGKVNNAPKYGDFSSIAMLIKDISA